MKRKRQRLIKRLRRMGYLKPKPVPAPVVMAFLCGGGPGDGSVIEALGYAIKWIDIRGFVHHYDYDLSTLTETAIYADYQGICGRVALKE